MVTSSLLIRPNNACLPHCHPSPLHHPLGCHRHHVMSRHLPAHGHVFTPSPTHCHTMSPRRHAAVAALLLRLCCEDNIRHMPQYYAADDIRHYIYEMRYIMRVGAFSAIRLRATMVEAAFIRRHIICLYCRQRYAYLSVITCTVTPRAAIAACFIYL